DLLASTQAHRDRVLASREEARQRAARLAVEAEDLRDLLRRLTAAEQAAKEAEQAEKAAKEADEAAPPAPRLALTAVPFSQARGRLPLPAEGRIVVRYGADDGSGQPAVGLTLQTSPFAQVVAPYDGEVVFAAPFGNYGL